MFRPPHRRSSARRAVVASAERLERRDCPATFGIIGSREIGEADGTAALTVQLSERLTKPVTVDYLIQGTATAGRDYRLTSGNSLLAAPTGRLTFSPGQTAQTISVGIVNDQLREGTETLNLTLFKPRGATLAANSRASVTILDDDGYTAAVSGPARVGEGGFFEYTVRLSSPATKSETLYVNTRSGLAVQGEDFRPLTQLPLVFKTGELSKSFRIQTLSDAQAETDEFFFLDVTSATPGFPPIAPFGVTIEGTGPAPLPSLSIADASVLEGESGQTAMSFTVTLSAAYGVPVTATYATRNGTATTVDRDFEGVPNGRVEIPAGATSAEITILINGDTRQEPDETFTVTLAAPTNATLTRATGTGTILNDDTPFTIVVRFPDSSLTPAQKQVFQRAAARWSQIIIGDLPDVTVNGRVIDDLEITATAPYIDGPYGVLGQAGPDALRTTGSRLPYTGSMEFDSADLAMMQADGTFEGVILHEMAHVIGIGSLWQSKGLLQNIYTTNPIYVGANALREYRQLAGNQAATGVPVENTGGPGTALGHWRESVFATELMTGYAEAAGTAMPISRMTVGSLQDMGYVVDYTKADPYVLPAGTSSVQRARQLAALPTTSKRLASHAQVVAAGFAAYAADVLHTAQPPARQRAFATLPRV
jgi:hypothetical protein